MSFHRITDTVFPLALAASLLGLLLSPLWAAVVPVGWLVTLGVCILLDLVLMYRILDGHFRPPGHYASLVYYVVFTVFGLRALNYRGLRDWWLGALAALISLHVICQYGGPAVHRRWGRSRRGAAGE
jgi:hypothetical protein